MNGYSDLNTNSIIEKFNSENLSDENNQYEQNCLSTDKQTSHTISNVSNKNKIAFTEEFPSKLNVRDIKCQNENQNVENDYIRFTISDNPSNANINTLNKNNKEYLNKNENEIFEFHNAIDNENLQNINVNNASSYSISASTPSIINLEDPKSDRIDNKNMSSNNCNKKNINENANRSSASHKKSKKIYAPKCICLVSLYPFCNELMKILRAIYKFSCTTRLKKPVEKIIENLTLEVPLPPRGVYVVNYHLSHEVLNLCQTKMNELPYVSIDLEKIFIYFKFEQIFEIYKQLLLETRLIFFSKDMSLLSPIIHGFLTLIYPFKYPFNFITVIPQENFPILDNITPFVFGINETYEKNFFRKHKLDISQYNYLVIDIDRKGIELNCPAAYEEPEGNSKKIFKKEFPDLPAHYKKKLHEKLKEYINKIKSNNTKESKEKFISSIRGIFYQFIVSIFINYSKFLNYDYYKNKDMAIPSVTNLFKVEEFLKTIAVEDRPFYQKFILETQQFADFIYKRMIPKDSKEKLEILLFDECITEKNNRKFMSKKVHTYFLQTTSYDFKTTYKVEKHKSLSQAEIDYYKNPENRKEALKYGVEVTFSDSSQKNNNSNKISTNTSNSKNNTTNNNSSISYNNDGDNNSNQQIQFNYIFFPTIMTDFYFKTNLMNYILPLNLCQNLEQINVEMISRSHLSKIINIVFQIYQLKSQIIFKKNFNK